MALQQRWRSGLNYTLLAYLFMTCSLVCKVERLQVQLVKTAPVGFVDFQFRTDGLADGWSKKDKTFLIIQCPSGLRFEDNSLSKIVETI